MIVLALATCLLNLPIGQGQGTTKRATCFIGEAIVVVDSRDFGTESAVVVAIWPHESYWCPKDDLYSTWDQLELLCLRSFLSWIVLAITIRSQCAGPSSFVKQQIFHLSLSFLVEPLIWRVNSTVAVKYVAFKDNQCNPKTDHIRLKDIWSVYCKRMFHHNARVLIKSALVTSYSLNNQWSTRPGLHRVLVIDQDLIQHCPNTAG